MTESGSEPEPERLLAVSEVVSMIGVSRVTLYRWVKDKSCGLPAPIFLSPRRIAWRESDLRRWIASRPVPDAYVRKEDAAA